MKLARAKRQHALLVDPDSIVHAFPAIVLEALRYSASANNGATIITADTVIRKHYAGAVW